MGGAKSSSGQNFGAQRQYRLASGTAEEKSGDISTEYGFALAVYRALRDFNRADRLRNNPLIGSHLVTNALKPHQGTSPVQALQDLLRSHCERLGHIPKTSRLQQVLQLTYIAPLRRQRMVCEALHLSWSTYRRYLRDATCIVTASLWEDECRLRFAPPVKQGLRFVRTWPWLTAATVVILGILSGAAYLHGVRSRREKATDAPPPLVLAVLPFQNLSRNSDDGNLLSAGLTSTLLARLGQIPGLQVTAEGPSCNPLGKIAGMRVAGCRSNVTSIIEGKIQSEGDALRIDIALVNPANGYESWSDDITAPRNQVFQIEDTLANAVEEHLHLPVNDPTAILADNYSTDIAGARDLYLVGMEYLNDRTTGSSEHAIHYFQKSVQMDPDYANAWAALAMAYAIWPEYTDGKPPDAHYDDALSAANKSVALDPSLPMAHVVLGYLHEKHWEWRQARQEYELALTLDPYDANAHQRYAEYFWLTGNVRQALRQMRIAHKLDPHLRVINAYLGRALLYAGEFHQAETQLRTGITLSPYFGLNYVYLAEDHMAMGQYRKVLDDANLAAKVTASPAGPSLLMEKGAAEADLGRRDLTRQYVAALQQRSPRYYVSGVLMARLYWSLGDQDHVFTQLQRAAKDHDHNLIMVSGPEWAGVRADPRFAAIRKMMGLPATGNPIH
ncbi:MAG: hypothetical protein ACRESE_07150 [Gammaproteobacteria bacterium]